jgi:hypothetical protein
MKLFPLALALLSVATAQPQRWTEKAANDWYARQPWLVGSNYIPANAINQLEFWQADTFDPLWIDTELTWAEELGMNTMRVFLHDLPWKQDASGFQRRIDRFRLRRTRQAHAGSFDSRWDHRGGQQRDPKPVHTRMDAEPGASPDDPVHTKGCANTCRECGAFRNDRRILAGICERTGQRQRPATKPSGE